MEISWLAKRGIRGIAKTQARLKRLTTEKNPDSSPQEVLSAVLQHRFRYGFGAGEEGRLNNWLGAKGNPTTLLDLCVIIALVEHKIYPGDADAVGVITDIIRDVLN